MIIVIRDYEIKPYVRMTRKGMYVSKQAQEYLASKEGLQLHYQSTMNKQGFTMLPGQVPLWALIRVTVHKSQGHRADLDNIIKAILDAGNGILYPDDRWIDNIEAIRFVGEPKLTLIMGVI
jgi:Holliday junction resolvase RusA-like endonuclease